MSHATTPAPASLTESDLNPFLFAAVGEGRNGMTLSVLSTLARLDLDPWQEAADMARLPAAAASRKLATFLCALPDLPLAGEDAGTIADRLIALLPRRAAATVLQELIGPAPGGKAGSWFLTGCLSTAFVLGLLWLLSGH